VRQGLVFQKGYCVPFGIEDQYIETLTGNPLREKEDHYNLIGTILITKPVLEDFEAIREERPVCGDSRCSKRKE
jgi:hypothetical protein